MVSHGAFLGILIAELLGLDARHALEMVFFLFAVETSKSFLNSSRLCVMNAEKSDVTLRKSRSR